MIVKICGLRDLPAALVAARAGADYLGFIFAPSKRQVTAESVASIREGLREAGFDTPMVGVFVDPAPDALSRAIEASGIDLVQFSGEESPDTYADLPVPVIKAIPAGHEDTFAALESRAEAWTRAELLLIDANDPSARGGTGKRANWDLARQLAAKHRVLLAGGLSPDNVANAITAVGPAGVDVASGVETNGVKDHAKIEAFVRAARGENAL